MPELLSPAGNLEKLKAAIRFGADAVYMSGPLFGMRAASAEMKREELAEAVSYAHAHGVRAYITVNTMPREDEYEALREYLLFLGEVKPDALIVADIGVLSLCRTLVPHIALHMSTQANAVSAAACRAWAELGASRIVLARELSLREIKMIRTALPEYIELEAFVHGSMCVSYSGRCLLSSHMIGRDANRGQCAQPCRWHYKAFLYEEKRPHMPIPVEEERGETFFMSSTDLCMIEHVKNLMDAGVASFKIEGRMKSAYYTAVVTNAYRMALDACKEGKSVPTDALMRELCSVSHRDYGTGFYFEDRPAADAHITEKSLYTGEKAYLADVLSYDEESGVAHCVQRNKLSCGELAEVLSPGQTGVAFTVSYMTDTEGNPIDSAPHPQMEFLLKMPFAVKVGDILRAPPQSEEVC